MRKTTLRNLLAYSGIVLLALSSCKDDSDLAVAPPVPDQTFVEEFDTLAVAKSRGWIIKNRSEPIGPGNWVQGLTGNQSSDYGPYSSTSTNTGFISADYTSAYNENPGEGTISNWVISPKVMMQNGDKIVFYSRCGDQNSDWGDRLQVLVNPRNDGAECGYGTESGDFTIVLLDINPQNASGIAVSPFDPADMIPFLYDPAKAYPFNWTRFEATVNGLSKPTMGRFAFRYFVPYGGTQGKGGHISIDDVHYTSVNH